MDNHCRQKRSITIPGFIKTTLFFVFPLSLFSQKQEWVKLVAEPQQHTVKVFVGKQLFASFLYPDSMEKPVLFDVHAANNMIVTRSFPLYTITGEPTDHPHHAGIWFNFENVNGLDFWNNSYAIPAEKKKGYGWIKTDRIIETVSGVKGILSYHANWKNQDNETLLEETTRFEFSGTDHLRIIDRITSLTAQRDVLMKDAKDGLLGFRMAHALQMPSTEDQEFTDNKGIKTIVKAGTDTVAKGNYLTSEGKSGNDAWSTRAVWCKAFTKMGSDSISVAIIDHPLNPNYPTYWHARGYGLFAANPLGENIFTKGERSKNLQIKKGETVIFRYRIVIESGTSTLSPAALNEMATRFSKLYRN